MSVDAHALALGLGRSRTPLPVEHPGNLDRLPTACEHPEGDRVMRVHLTRRCRGCLALAVTEAATDPDAVVLVTTDGVPRETRIVDALRASLDPCDPLLVHLERELARRKDQRC